MEAIPIEADVISDISSDHGKLTWQTMESEGSEACSQGLVLVGAVDTNTSTVAAVTAFSVLL